LDYELYRKLREQDLQNKPLSTEDFLQEFREEGINQPTVASRIRPLSKNDNFIQAQTFRKRVDSYIPSCIKSKNAKAKKKKFLFRIPPKELTWEDLQDVGLRGEIPRSKYDTKVGQKVS
jgi:hypothetical protein